MGSWIIKKGGHHPSPRSLPTTGQFNDLPRSQVLRYLKPPAVEVMIGKDLTIHQFEHTKLIAHHVTFSINTVAVDVCCRTIITADVQKIGRAHV